MRRQYPFLIAGRKVSGNPGTGFGLANARERLRTRCYHAKYGGGRCALTLLSAQRCAEELARSATEGVAARVSLQRRCGGMKNMAIPESAAATRTTKVRTRDEARFTGVRSGISGSTIAKP